MNEGGKKRNFLSCYISFWSQMSDSNWQPSDYKTAAITY